MGRQTARALWGRRVAAGLTAAALAAALGACGSAAGTAAAGTAESVIQAPAQVAQTALGPVGYRVVGSGPPLILIMGYAGTMQTWEPQFVNTLALRNRVVIFDNAGIGATAAVPNQLTIDAMANQTSALITALGLGRPDVLGWSMGSMIAQALAVLHPDQVNRLVLSASYPGNGTTTRPAQQALSALENGDEQQVMADLFPADQVGAGNAYLAATSSYPAAPAVAAGVLAAQRHAIDAWWAGQDSAGTRAATITAPTLIADGAADRLDPAGNSHTLAGLIPGARLTLFPDAGHAFLFQDQAVFIPQIESFLG